MKRMLVFSGAPCSGKDSAVKEIGRNIFFPSLPMSTELRKLEKTAHPEDWSLIKLSMKRGFLVPDEFAVPAIQQALEGMTKLADESAMLNGVVRSPRQAEVVLAMCFKHKWDVIVFDVQATDEVCRRRSVNRYRDQGRDDDVPEIFERRLGIFKDYTVPAIKLLVDSGARYHDVGGNGTNDEAVAQILPHLDLDGVRA